mgnify:CR=1 FL=1
MIKNKTGVWGEVYASRYLRDSGYEIIDANYVCRFGEIDIVAEDKKYICFVEVKTRSENMKYAPSDAVDIIKRTKIIASSQLFLKDYKLERQPRYDIIEVYFENDEPVRLNHIENAFDSNAK